jgi:hypothetical protein
MFFSVSTMSLSQRSCAITADTSLGGYRVDITEDQLKGAPKFNRSTDWDWSDRSRDRTVHDYYNTPMWYGGSQGGAHTVPDPETRGV